MVRVVTDSVADLPPALADSLGITVVPIVVRFGSEEFRDGIDLSPDQFYERLRASPKPPATSMPPLTAFAEVYRRLAAGGDSILAVMVSSRLSGTWSVAQQAREMVAAAGRIEVMDTGTATMAQGFIAMRAAQAARAGASLPEVLEAAERTRRRVDFLCTFDTLEYLRRGGRIGAVAPQGQPADRAARRGRGAGGPDPFPVESAGPAGRFCRRVLADRGAGRRGHGVRR
jgi:DegV family protein with EDD domain